MWDYLLGSAMIGIGATMVMDLWGYARQRWLRIPRLDYALLGRWVGHMPRGCFRHRSIASATPIRGERLIGWGAHYLIGILFAALLLAVYGTEWLEHPSIGPALLVGATTVVAPLFVMQPAMGMGIAASRAPDPAKARMHSLLTHTIYGFGLYLAARIVHLASWPT